MSRLPGQLDVLRWLMDYRKKYGPINDGGVENLADYLADAIRSSLSECEGAILLDAAVALRAAQRAYMADRGNDTLGKKVAEAADVLDAAIAVETGSYL